MKKKLLLALVCLLVFALGSACSGNCNSNGNKENAGYGEIVNAGGSEEKQIDSLSFEDDSLDVIVGDETALKLSFASAANASPTFSSSDIDVVRVDSDGIVSALKAGNATITATLGNLTDTINVTVGYGSYLPTGKFLNVFLQTGDLQISMADSIDFSSTVYFNSKRFDDAQVSYECTGDGSMNGNIFTPTSAGKATVKVNVVWRGFDIYLSRNEFTVKIVHDVQLYINDNDSCSFELYTAEALTTAVGTKTFVHTLPFVIRGKVDGQDIVADQIKGELTEGKDVVNIENNVITGIKQGRATYTLTYNDGEKEYKKSIPIEVKVSIADYNTVPIRFSASDGKLEDISWKTIFGDDKIVAASIGKTSLTVESEGVVGLKVKATDKRTTQTLTVQTDKVGYNFQVVPYTMILKTPQDFDVFTIKEAVVAENGKIESATCFDGYYILGNDITWDKDSATHWVDPFKTLEKASLVQVHKEGGLTGIFDGEGHTVTGMKVANMGIFGLVCGGTICNVGFEKLDIIKDSSYNNSWWGGKSKSGIAYSILDGVFENVYIHAEKLDATRGNNQDTGGNRSLIATIMMGTTCFKNCIFKLDQMDNIGTAEGTTSQYTHGFGSFVNYDMRTINSDKNWDGNAAKVYDRADWTGVYVISPVPLAVHKAGASNITFFMDDSTHAENTIKDYGGTEVKATVIKRYDSESKTYVDCTSILRYDSEDAFKAATENDYSEFINEYWDTSSGIPVWKQQ